VVQDIVAGCAPALLEDSIFSAFSRMSVMKLAREQVSERNVILASRMTRGYVSEVDALRGLAMTGVVAQHCGLLPFGWTGVWLFYVISGFAITSSLLASDRESLTKATLIGNFYVRRCLRIWPLYFTFVIGNMLAALIVRRSDVLASGPWLATFSYNFRMTLHDETWTAIGHLWTISVEEQFYLVFPFLFALLSRRRLVMALWTCIVFSPMLRLLLTCWLDRFSQDNLWKAFALYAFAPVHFDAFSAGALIALFRPFLASRLQLARAFLTIALGVAMAYACIYVCINVSAQGIGKDCLRNVFSGILWGQGRQIWLYSTIVGLAVALIALILAGEPWLLTICRMPLIRPIGRISYGAYLFHLPVLVLIPFFWHVHNGSSVIQSISKFAFAYPVTLLIAFLSFRYFEQPILKLRGHFGRIE
jgi:peptidoglycan/LPS O-acetylase OafA/YrhL